jgi:hypothetical protein
MTTATKEAPHVAVGHNDRAWFDLEEPIRDLTYMAGIARDLAYELLNIEARKNPDSDVVIRMSERDQEQFFFAIDNVYDRAKAIEKTYYPE